MEIDDNDIKLTPIGNVDQQDGSDAYMLLTNLADDITPEQAHDWLLPRVYRDTSIPGGRYCHTVLVSQYPYSTNKVICIVQNRYDV